MGGNGGGGHSSEYPDEGGDPDSGIQGGRTRRIEWVIILNNFGHSYADFGQPPDTRPGPHHEKVTVANNFMSSTNARSALVTNNRQVDAIDCIF